MSLGEYSTKKQFLVFHSIPARNINIPACPHISDQFPSCSPSTIETSSHPTQGPHCKTAFLGTLVNIANHTYCVYLRHEVAMGPICSAELPKQLQQKHRTSPFQDYAHTCSFLMQCLNQLINRSSFIHEHANSSS